ncbi:MAG: hypothetical protein ACI9J3_002297 [Parvicellaceae bacterium]
MRVNRIISVAAVLLLFVSSCKKKEITEPCNSIECAGTINLNFQHVVDTSAFAFNTDFIDDFGNTYQFSRVDWYLHVPGFLESDNSTSIVDSNEFFKMDPSVTTVIYGASSCVDHHYMRWGVGVDSAENHMDPNTHPLSHGLGNQSPSLHWGWSTGYIFCAIEGLVDINGDGSFGAGEYFSLHVGVDTNYRTGPNLLVDTNVSEDGIGIMNLKVDYAAFINGIDLSIDNYSHTMDNMPLAIRVADNFDQVLDLQ